MHILVTAGGTREFIDPVRYITNASSGKMGYALARAAIQAGHSVTLISAPTHLRAPRGVKLVPVQTAQDMFVAVKEHFAACDVLIMAAAVSDYTVSEPADRKLKKKKKSFTLRLEPTVDILQWAGAEKLRLQKKRAQRNPWIVGFALEDEDLHGRAEAKLGHKSIDMIVANHPDAIGAAASTVHLKTPSTPWRELPQATKITQAKRIVRAIEEQLD